MPSNMRLAEPYLSTQLNYKRKSPKKDIKPKPGTTQKRAQRDKNKYKGQGKCNKGGEGKGKG